MYETDVLLHCRAVIELSLCESLLEFYQRFYSSSQACSAQIFHHVHQHADKCTGIVKSIKLNGGSSQVKASKSSTRDRIIQAAWYPSSKMCAHGKSIAEHIQCTQMTAVYEKMRKKTGVDARPAWNLILTTLAKIPYKKYKPVLFTVYRLVSQFCISFQKLSANQNFLSAV